LEPGFSPAAQFKPADLSDFDPPNSVAAFDSGEERMAKSEWRIVSLLQPASSTLNLRYS
jgi:hypothetical protein